MINVNTLEKKYIIVWGSLSNEKYYILRNTKYIKHRSSNFINKQLLEKNILKTFRSKAEANKKMEELKKIDDYYNANKKYTIIKFIDDPACREILTNYLQIKIDHLEGEIFLQEQRDFIQWNYYESIKKQKEKLKNKLNKLKNIQ